VNDEIRRRRRKGTGSIEPLPDGRFRAKIGTPAGRRDMGTYGSREEAEAILDAARAAILDQHETDGLTLLAWGDRSLDRREQEGYRSISTDRSRWRAHLSRASISQLVVRDVRTSDVLEWLDGMRTKRAADNRERRKLSKQTVVNSLNLLREILEDAVQRGIISENPARGVRVQMRSVSTEDPWTWLELWEQDAIYRCDSIPLHARLWMAFAWGTGLREGEQFNLRLEDVFLNGAAPHIIVRRGSKQHGPKDTRAHRSTRSKIRRVPLFGIARDALERWLDMLPRYCPKNPHGLVFPGPTGAAKQKGKPIHVTRREGPEKRPVGRNPMPEYLAAAGITADHRHDGRAVRWHDLRHTCAASLVSGWWGRTWSLEEVRSLLGHSSVSVTERYAHLADSALSRAAAETRLVNHRAAISPQGFPDAANHAESQGHLRDLNPRPTVYETGAFRSDSKHLDANSTRARAYRAVLGVQNGQVAEARRLLDEFTRTGAPMWAVAASEAESGRWARALDLLRQVAERKAEK
jgi:integrase